MKSIIYNICIFIIVLGYSEMASGASCSAPYNITSVPFVSSSSSILTTCGAGTNGVATQCTGSYGGTEEAVVFTYTAAASGAYQVSLSASATYGGIFFHDGSCTGTCIGSVVTGSGTSATGTVTLTAGTTYYIIITTWTAPDCTAFQFSLNYIPPPSNNECSGATPISVNPTTLCSSTATNISTLGATQSLAGCLGTADDDVWFSFVATSPALNVSVAGNSIDMVHQVFSGACGSQTSLNCSDPNTSTITNLTVGNTYYLRLYTFAAGNNVSTTSLCINTPSCVKPGIGGAATITSAGCPSTYSIAYNVTTLGTASSVNITNASGYTVTPATITTVPTIVTISGIPTGTASGVTTLVSNSSSCNTTLASVTSGCPPLSDNCSTTNLAVTPNTSTVCTTTLPGVNTSFATQSEPGCLGTADDDIWVSFVASSNFHNISIVSATDIVHQVFTGACGSQTTLSCSDPNTSSLSNLTIGNTYYMRIYSYSLGNIASNINVCITTPDCVKPAIGGSVSISTAGCPSTYSVSFNVTSLGSASSLNVSNTVGTASPATITSVPTLVTISGIPIGTASGVITLVHNASASCNLTLASQTSPVCPAANDICSTATSITQSNTTLCGGATSGNMAGATDNNETGDCTNGTEKAIWYSFTATNTSAIVTVVGSTGFDAVIGALTTCGSTTVPTGGTCKDNTYDAGTETLALAGLTVGNTYYVQVYDYYGGTNASNTFTICVTTPPPPPNCSAGNPTPADECANAPVLNNPNGFCGTTSNSYTAGDPNPSCGSSDNNSYLQFVAADVSLSITWWVTSGSPCTDGVQFAIFSGSCASPTLVSGTCINPTGGSGSTGTWNISGLTVDATYYIYIDGYAGDVCDYVFAAQSGVQLPIELTYFNGKVSNGVHYLNWATASERKNAYFEVERSFDGTQFTKLGKVISKANQGISVQKLTYDYTDLEPADGINYYRLKQVDLDGKHFYSKVISLSSSKESNSIKNLYPNPTSSKLDLMVQVSQEDFYVIEVYDILGKRVDVQKIVLFDGINQHSYDASLLSKGYYRMMLKDEKGQILSKNSFIKN